MLHCQVRATDAPHHPSVDPSIIAAIIGSGEAHMRGKVVG
jgi:hypothetical protein